MSSESSEHDFSFDSSRTASLAGLCGLALLVALYLTLAITSAKKESVTVDEFGHLPGGVHFLKTGDPRYCSLNPPLVNALSALPVLVRGWSERIITPPASDDPASFWPIGRHFLENQREDYVRIFAAARVMPIVITATLGIFLFFWARGLASEAPAMAGMLAAALVLLSPNVIAHSRIVGTDTGTAFFVALAVFAFQRMLGRPDWRSVLLCGLLLGLAQLTKFYALLLYPAMLGSLVAHTYLEPPAQRRWTARLAGLSSSFLVSLVVLNSGYLWRELGRSLSELSLRSESLQGLQSTLVGRFPMPLPAAYLRAFDSQLAEVASSMPSFLLGQTFEGGRWYYYLAVLAFKSALPLLLVFALAVYITLFRPSVSRRDGLLLLAYPALLFVSLSLGSGRQLGARALLSAVPLVQLWIAITIASWKAEPWRRLVFGTTIASMLAISLWSYPDYLSHFNVLAGGSKAGYLFASGSNVDIGQDLVGLADYLESEGVEKIQLLYFGSVDPALYGIDYEVPFTDTLKPGLLAVSVSFYHMAYPAYDHGELRVVGPVKISSRPEATIGGSIHVYRLE